MGRTALLVNLASYWATMGRVVAVVDMDLAAPGVSYSPLLESNPIDRDMPPYGVHELLAVYYQEKTEEDPRLFGFASPSRLFRRLRPPSILGDQWPQNGAVLVLPAGLPEKEMRVPVPTWIERGISHALPPKGGRTGENPEEKSWRAFAKLFREDMEEYRLEIKGVQRSIDLLLIDCRTGLSELLDLSLGYLADHMVLVSGINQQNREGLRQTLKSLRKPEEGEPRIPFNQYGNTLTVAFSPIPVHIHDDPDSQRALRESEAILGAFRIPPPDDKQQPESLPPVFTLPYTTRLLHSDEPLYPLGGRDHPYIRVLLDMARRLEPENLAEEMREIEKELVRVGGKRAPSDIPMPDKRSIASLLQLTNKWYWPWFDGAEDAKAAGWKEIEKFLGPDEDRAEVDIFLDGLCSSISLDQHEKRNLLKKPIDWQRRELVNIFNNERQKVESFKDQFFGQYGMVLFQRQKEWASLMLGDEAGVKQFFEQLKNILKDDKNSEVDYRRVMNERGDIDWNRSGNLPIDPLNYGRDGEADYHRSISVGEKEVVFWISLGDMLQGSVNHPEEAEAAYRRAIELDGKIAQPWINMGNLFQIHLHRFDDAEAAYRRAIELDEKNAWTWNGLGGLLQQHLKRPEEAEAAYRRAIELDEKFAWPWNNLGVLLRDKLNRPEEAEAAFRRAAELDKK